MDSDWHVQYFSCSSIHSYPSQCGSWLSVLGKATSRVASSSSHCLSCISTLGSTRAGYVGISCSVSSIFLGKSSNSGGLGVECIQSSLDVSGKLWLSSSCISPAGSVQISGRTCHSSIQTSDSGGIMLYGGSLASHSSQHVGNVSQCCPVVKDLVMDVLVGQVFRALPYLHLTIWLLRNMCCAVKGSLPQSVRWWQGQLEYLEWRSTSNVVKNGQVGALKREYHTM